MTDRRRRGARRSSNCFQTSSAFGFLFFMDRSRKEVDSSDRVGICAPDRVGIFDRKLKVERTERIQRREHREHGGRSTQAGSDEPGECGAKKKKGETVVKPQVHPELL